MICKKCKTENRKGSSFCVKCGYELTPHKSMRFLLLLVLLVIVILIGVFMLLSHFNRTRLTAKEQTPIIATIDKLITKEFTPSETELPPATPGFSIFSITKNDNSVFKRTFYIPREGIIALPLDKTKEIRKLSVFKDDIYTDITEGHWDTDDNILFFKLPEKLIESYPPTLSTARFNPDKPLYILSPDIPQKVKLDSYQVLDKKGDILVIETPNLNSQQNSILIQDNNLVGWIFPLFQKNTAYLWLGEEFNTPAEQPLIPLETLNLFFSSPDIVKKKIESLNEKAIRNSFYIFTRFFSHNNIHLQNYLDRSSVLIFYMAQELSRYNYDKDITEYLNPGIVAALQNKDILSIFAWSNASLYGYGKAIGILQNINEVKKHSGSFSLDVSSMIANFYVVWLESLLVAKDSDNALNVYNYAIKDFPNEQRIRLIGAEIYLSLQQTSKAEDIMRNTLFDAKYEAEASRIKKVINDMKASENKIVIKFEPSLSGSITLNATINDSINQKFILDTGASLVSIPTSTARALKLNTASAKDIMISTASGIFPAKEINLNSLTINNIKVYNIKAVIIDLPDDKEMGLLGMSFLNKFKVNLDNSSGVLLLIPKEN